MFPGLVAHVRCDSRVDGRPDYRSTAEGDNALGYVHLRTTSLAPQIACYGEPIGALILLAIAELGAGTNWVTISVGLAIVVGAGLFATVTRATRPAGTAV